jgi:hypothetical protein
MRPIDPDEFVDSLEFTDRQRFCRLWGKFLIKGKVECVTDRLLNAAFSALEQFDAIPTSDWDRFTGGCMLGLFRVIRQGITERPSQAEQFACRVANFCSSPNLDVAAAAIRQFEPLDINDGELRLEQYHGIAIPALRRAAAVRRERPQSTSMTVRGLAFHVLYELDSTVLFCRELREARFECAQAYFKWAVESDWRVEEHLLKANTFIWYS